MSGPDDPAALPVVLLPADELPKPAVVEEAERTLARFGLGLGAAGVAATVFYWSVTLALGYPFVPMSWWVMFLVTLVAVFFFPPSREASNARDALRRYDRLRIDQRLEGSGTVADPRLRVAEAMATRILGGPGLDAGERKVVVALQRAIRDATRDLRLAEAASRGPAAGSDPGQRALSDLADVLEARAARLLGALAELQAAVVRRERHEVEAVLDEVGDLVRQVEASDEVARLLGKSDRGREG